MARPRGLFAPSMGLTLAIARASLRLSKSAPGRFVEPLTFK